MKNKPSKKNKKDIEPDKYIGKTNVADFGVPSGVQLTENMNEEIAEAARKRSRESHPEK